MIYFARPASFVPPNALPCMIKLMSTSSAELKISYPADNFANVWLPSATESTPNLSES